jgi:hypothetical protein
MTSSATSTEPAATGGPPAVISKHNASRERLVVAGVAGLPAVAIVVGMYGSALSVAALFLALGWVSLALTGWHLYRAAVALDGDLSTHDTVLTEDHRVELEREKKLLLKAIKETEFDHAMGKMDDDDASHVTGGYRARALEIMRELDQDKPRDFGALIDKEVARRLAKAGVDPGQVMGEAPAEPKKATAVGVCPECGTGNDVDAVFCKKCGQKMGGLA